MRFQSITVCFPSLKLPRFLTKGSAGKCKSIPVAMNSIPGSGGFGTAIYIVGNNLFYATNVLFNGVSASFIVVSNSQIIAVVPPNAASGPISVFGAAGGSVSTNSFTIISAPTCVSQPSGLVAYWPADGNGQDIIGGHYGCAGQRE